MKLILLLIPLVFSFESAVSASPMSMILCKNKSMVRTIRIEKGDASEGCVVKYTKGGTDQIVGSGVNTNGCGVVVDKVRSNLEEGWWRCRNVKKFSFDDQREE